MEQHFDFTKGKTIISRPVPGIMAPEDRVLEFVGYGTAFPNAVRRCAMRDVKCMVVVPGDDIDVRTNTCIHFLELKNKLTIPVRWDPALIEAKIRLLICDETEFDPIVATTKDRVVLGADVTVMINGVKASAEQSAELIAPQMYICTLKPENFIFASMPVSIVSGKGYCKAVTTSYECLSRKELTTGVCPVNITEEQDLAMCDTWVADQILEAAAALAAGELIEVGEPRDPVHIKPLVTRVKFHYNWFREIKDAMSESLDAIGAKLDQLESSMSDPAIKSIPDRKPVYTYRIDSDDSLGNLIAWYGVEAFGNIFETITDPKIRYEAYRTSLVSYDKKQHDVDMTIRLKLPDVEPVPGIADYDEFLNGVIGGIRGLLDQARGMIDKVVADPGGIPKVYTENPFHK